MPTATCTPGQGGVPAIANAPVFLEPDTGDFGNRPPEVNVRLYSSHGGNASMTVDDWKPDRILAEIPLNNPGDGLEGERFKVVINANGYESDPVDVVGPAGGYPLPPVHLTGTVNLHLEVAEGNGRDLTGTMDLRLEEASGKEGD